MTEDAAPVVTPPAGITTRWAPAISTAETRAIVGSPRAVRRRVGSSDLEVFPIALSGNVFGWTADSAESERVLDSYVARGGNFVDTADSYAGGRSEIILGNWLRARGARDDIVLATKVGKSADHPGVSARAITAAVEASLRRLRTDRIDLLYLHIDDPDVPFEETLLAVDELVRSGKVRYFGGSHHTGDRLIEARIASAQLGVARMVALQNHYNLVFRSEYEQGLAGIAATLSLGVMPRFALASGFLTGKYRSKTDLDRTRRAEVGRYLNRSGMRVLQALDVVAAEHDAPLATIALAWLLSKPDVVAPVVSASAADQVFDLVAAAEVNLTRSQLTALDRAGS
ncbi:aldo/keto reductase [Pseudolysinimonas sp.]|jgi:aryl-alcohol dehydrogenase-like predicted oxidoreductase|uniref:aldo/keto reductase n=1 Tax=Pseudolysinimonas sp. TaxID=2680009 RepID=UPI003784AEE6